MSLPSRWQLLKVWSTDHWPSLMTALASLAATLVLIWILRKLLSRFLLKYSGERENELIPLLAKSAGRPVTWCGLAIGIRLALMQIPLPSFGQDESFWAGVSIWMERLTFSAIVIAVAASVNVLLNAFCQWLIQHETQAQKAQQILLTDLIRRSLAAVIWFLTFFFLLQNVFSLNVSALLAGAGVIGLALAFAAQNTVANLFGAVSLIGDTPFKVGDWIKVGDQEGTVEGIGLRSMRLRAFTGELFIIPNRLAADASITNYTARKHFRQTLNVSLTYSTTSAQMTQAMNILQEILDEHPVCNRLRKPIIAFNEMKDWSLNIMVIIWFDTQDLQQKNQEISSLNLQILERFNAAGLEFAFPTNTTYLVNTK